MLKSAVVDHPFLAGGGEAGQIIAQFNWAATSLGPIESWPQSRKSAISLILRSPVPMVTLWGEDGIMIYNNAYSEFAGGRHPDIFGAKVREAWPEVANFNDNVMKVGLSGATLAYRDQELTLVRHGVPETVWLNLDYSPLHDEEGYAVGVFAVVVENTGKIRAERELQAERESLRLMFEQAPGFIALVTGRDHRFTLVNESFYALVRRRDLLGRTVREALPEVAGQGFIDLLDRVYTSGRPFVGRGVSVDFFPEPDASVQTRYVDFIYQPVVADDGAVTGIFVQGHDVTEQKRVELALRESEERFRLVAENAPVMLWMVDEQSRCVYFNNGQRKFWGVEPEAVAGFDWVATVHPDDAVQLAAIERAMETHTSFSVEFRLRRADGAYRTVVASGEPRFGPDGAFLGMIGVNVDVTEARATEAAIRKESGKLAVLNRSGAAIAAELDIGKIVQIVTDASTELVGAEFGAFFYNVVEDGQEFYSLYALSGASPEAFSAFPMPRATQVFRPTFVGESVVRVDDILEDPRYGRNPPHNGMPEGHLPVRSYLAVPVTLRNGQVVGNLLFGHKQPGRFLPEHEDLLIGIAGQAATAVDNARLFRALEQELTERRRAEAALQALNATLEQRVIDEVYERTKAEEQLRQVQKMEAVGQLTGGIAHDFNNMLAVVISGLNLLQRRLARGDTDVDRFVEGALDGAQRAASLTQRLLAFSRQQPLAPEIFKPGELLSGMSDLLVRTIGETIQVEMQVAEDVWNVRADPGQLENAILNLSVNARDAMPGGGRLGISARNITLDVRTAEELALPAGDYVRISVSDTGGGMAPEVVSRAFEPFYTTKDVGKGTGLGLSQVYGFVRQSGGTVKIASSGPEGTTVAIYLPRHIGEAPKLVRNAEAAPGRRGSPHEVVLVVEDEERVRALSVEALRELGYSVIEAAQPVEALRLLKEQGRVSLLFTDVVMPGMSGRELADAARQVQPDLKVLYTTGYARNALPGDGLLDQTASLLTKPFSLKDLSTKVRRMLDS